MKCSTRGCSNEVSKGKKCEECAEKVRQYKRDRIAKKIATGICVRCSKKAEPDNKLCREHLAKDLMASAAYRETKGKSLVERKKEFGICTKCTKLAVPGRTMCEYHLEDSNRRSKEAYEKYKREGTCLHDGRPVTPGHVFCDRCLKQAAKARAHERVKRRAEGLCPDCGKRPPAADAKKCTECQKYLVDRYHKMKAEVFAAYGGFKCNYPGCDVTDPKMLTIDHVNKDGAAHRKIVGQRNMYRWLKKNNYPLGFQVLCWNHNCGLRYD